MPKWLKVVLIFIGVSVLGLALLVGGIVWWVSANKERLAETGKKAQENGVSFGATHTQDQCVDEGLSHLKECGALDFLCEAGNKIALMSCMAAAKQDGTCRDVPSRDDIFKLANWANEECARRGFRGSQQCTRMIQAIPDACARDQR